MSRMTAIDPPNPRKGGSFDVGRKQLAVHDGFCQWLETLSPTSHQEFQLNSRLMV
jgi:hypothetical protein